MKKNSKYFFTNLRGKRYKIVFSNLKKIDGDCDSPSTKHKTIRIRNGIKNPYRLLELAIHEGAHACWFDLDEESINSGSEDIAKLVCKVLKRYSIKLERIKDE